MESGMAETLFVKVWEPPSHSLCFILFCHISNCSFELVMKNPDITANALSYPLSEPFSLSLSPVVKCEPPKPIPNGQPRPPVNEMYEYGQAVQYVCNGDSTMLGANDTVHCLENGSWSDVPRCASKLGSSVGLSWLYGVPQGASMLGGLVITCANCAVVCLLLRHSWLTALSSKRYLSLPRKIPYKPLEGIWWIKSEMTV